MQRNRVFVFSCLSFCAGLSLWCLVSFRARVFPPAVWQKVRDSFALSVVPAFSVGRVCRVCARLGCRPWKVLRLSDHGKESARGRKGSRGRAERRPLKDIFRTCIFFKLSCCFPRSYIDLFVLLWNNPRTTKNGRRD